MPQILKIKAFYSNYQDAKHKNPADKVYAVAVILDNGFYKVLTFSSARGKGKLPSIRPYAVQANSIGIQAQFNAIVKTRFDHHYVVVEDWRDEKYQPIKDVVSSWGTPPDEKSEEQPIVIKPVAVAAPVRKSSRVPVVVPDSGRSFGSIRDI